MKNLILKIKSYQEDVTYLTLNVPANLSNEQLKSIALDCKKIVDGFTSATASLPPGSPNIMRFENKEGIYNYEMKQLVAYKIEQTK